MQHLDTKPIIPGPETQPNPFHGLVSVIIPTYNCASTLPESIRSLQNQTYTNIEIIVSDDASTDDTEAVVEGLGVRYLKQEVNSGAAVARNTGAEQAKGRIFIFAEADGYYEPDYVEKVIRYLHLPEVGGAICLGRIVWTDLNTPLVRHQNDLLAAAAQRIAEGKRGTGAWAFRPEVFWEIGGYDPECRIGQDMDLVRRMVRAGWKTVSGGYSPLHHKDPDTLKKYWRRAFRGGFFSGRFQAKWKNNSSPVRKALYVFKYGAMAAAPLYLLFAFLINPLWALLFLGVAAYLLTEDSTTTLAWSFSLKRGDLATFALTPIFLYIRRLAIGWGRIKSFFFEKP